LTFELELDSGATEVVLMKKAILVFLFVGWAIVLGPPLPVVYATDLGAFFQVGAAFISHMAVHESGHYIMAHMGGAKEVQLNFFTIKGGNFYLGLSTARGLGRESSLPYKIAGEAASSYHFEVALRSYRAYPNTYNRARLFFSGTDFLWYSLYAFYLTPNRNPNYDPVGISQETGLSAEAVLGLAAFQTALNAYRVYSGNDALVPYFALDKRWAEFGVQMRY
jgi:hypothetical protein